MSDLDINVLIIGKSGVGKSSLLNYLFGSKAAESGTGKPVTDKGIYSYSCNSENGIKLNIYDTWGLEADKADEWKRLILEEVKKHDQQNIKDWFHIILYCFSAKASRIETFEEEIIKDLLDSNNKVVTVLTHCDLKGIEQSIDAMKKRLLNLSLKEKDIICVCSEKKTLLGGKVTEPFGKEEILAQVKSELWERIKYKLPGIVEDYGLSHIFMTIIKCQVYVDEKITFRNRNSKKVAQEISEYCNQRIELCSKEIELYYKDKMMEMFEFYYQLCQKMLSSEIEAVKKPYIDFSFTVDFQMDCKTVLAENIASSLFLVIPGVNLLVPKALADIRRDNIKKDLFELNQKFAERIHENRLLLEKQLGSI